MPALPSSDPKQFVQGAPVLHVPDVKATATFYRDVLGFTWDFGDGHTASGTLTPEHAFADAGTYTVTLTVSDNDGGTHSDALTVIVEPAGLSITAFDVQKGALQRSFVRYLDVTFNQPAELAAMVASVNDANPGNDRVRLLRYDLNGGGPGVPVNLTGKVAAIDSHVCPRSGSRGVRVASGTGVVSCAAPARKWSGSRAVLLATDRG